MKKTNIISGRNINIKTLSTKLSSFKQKKKNFSLNLFFFSKQILHKHSITTEQYNTYIINAFLSTKKGHYKSIYKDNEIYMNDSEHLKRLYLHSDSKERIPKYAFYYKDYLLFFCKPLIKDFKMNKMLMLNMEKIAQNFYNKNYKKNPTFSEKNSNKTVKKVKPQEFKFFNLKVVKELEKPIEITNDNFNEVNHTNELISSLADVSKIEPKENKDSRNKQKLNEQILNTSISSLLSLLLKNKEMSNNNNKILIDKENKKDDTTNGSKNSNHTSSISNYNSGRTTYHKGFYPLKIKSESVRNFFENNKIKKELSVKKIKSNSNYFPNNVCQFKSPKVQYSKYTLRLMPPLNQAKTKIGSPNNSNIKLNNILSSPTRRNNVFSNNIINCLPKHKLSGVQKKIKSFSLKVDDTTEERKNQKLKMLNNLYSGSSSTTHFKKESKKTLTNYTNITKIKNYYNEKPNNIFKFIK